MKAEGRRLNAEDQSPKRKRAGICIFCGVRHTAATKHCQPDTLDAAHRKALHEEQDWFDIEPPQRSDGDRFEEASHMLEDS